MSNKKKRRERRIRERREKKEYARLHPDPIAEMVQSLHKNQPRKD